MFDGRMYQSKKKEDDCLGCFEGALVFFFQKERAENGYEVVSRIRYNK